MDDRAIGEMSMPKTLKTTRRQKKVPASNLPVAYENEMHRIIEVSAYLIAEKDQFKQSPIDYWLAAEKEVHTVY
jgi:Protein of unknown function (DUF2934)